MAEQKIANNVENQPTPTVEKSGGFAVPENEPKMSEVKVSEQEKPAVAVPISQSTATATAPADIVEKEYKEVESILEEDLEETYNQLSPQDQQKFKKVGEETTKKIMVLLSKAKVKAKKIIGLIVAWLKIIPGVNKFFLEQMAKIKTDRILNIVKNKGKDIE